MYKGKNPRDAEHKFLAEAIDRVIFVHVAENKRHRQLAERFHIPEIRRVGGGSCYLNGDSYLVLDGYSGDYGSIPAVAAQKFAELLRIRLESRKPPVRIGGIAVHPDEWQLEKYWKHKGF